MTAALLWDTINGTSIICRFTRFLGIVHHVILKKEHTVQELGLFPSSEKGWPSSYSDASDRKR
jgi:hypothetical protein